ncbi:MAG: hypothetical protein ACQEVA_02480 [Myxococcota bacterium]
MKYPKATHAIALFLALSLSAGCIPQGDGGGNNGSDQDSGGGIDTGTNDAGGDSAEDDTGGGEDTGEQADSGGDSGGGGGLQGLEGYCEYYFECGGSYYSDVDDCVTQSIDYWGECRRDELDAFGDCMLDLTCEEWGNPDAYNPSNTSCSEEWSAISESPSCE